MSHEGNPDGDREGGFKRERAPETDYPDVVKARAARREAVAIALSCLPTIDDAIELVKARLAMKPLREPNVADVKEVLDSISGAPPREIISRLDAVMNDFGRIPAVCVNDIFAEDGSLVNKEAKWMVIFSVDEDGKLFADMPGHVRVIVTPADKYIDSTRAHMCDDNAHHYIITLLDGPPSEALPIGANAYDPYEVLPKYKEIVDRVKSMYNTVKDAFDDDYIVRGPCGCFDPVFAAIVARLVKEPIGYPVEKTGVERIFQRYIGQNVMAMPNECVVPLIKGALFVGSVVVR